MFPYLNRRANPANSFGVEKVVFPNKKNFQIPQTTEAHDVNMNRSKTEARYSTGSRTFPWTSRTKGR